MRTSAIVAGRVSGDLALGSQAALIGLDRGGSVLKVSPAAAAILGIEPGAASGCGPAELGRLVGDDEFGRTLSRLIGQGCAASVVMPFTFTGAPSAMVGMTLLPAGDGGDGSTVLLTAFPAASRRSFSKARVAAFLGLSVVILAGVAVAKYKPDAALPPSPGPMALSSAGPMLVAAETSSVVSSLSVVGAIEPGRTVNVIAPFAGAVERKPVDYGSYVKRGQDLLIMNSSELEMKIRDAEAAFLKAEQRIEEARNWTASPEVLRARRQIASAERDANQARRRVQDAKPLFDQDIIPRQEYEELQRQLEAQASTLAAAQDDLAAALKRGGPDIRRMAELELGNARARLEELQEQRKRAAVKAPLSGLVLKPPASGSSGQSGSATIEAGSSVSGNQIVLMIADMETLMVSARVDEMDINRIHIGQPVEVTGDAFPGGVVQGRISWVSSQGTVGENGSPSATFGIHVALPALPEDQKRYARFGMSVNLSINVYDNPSAVVVPHQAVQKTPAGVSMRIVDSGTGAETVTPVTIGETTPNGLEIRDGVKPGDMMVIDSAR